MTPMHSSILILDFGAQYTQLIARRVRELNVYCEIHPFDVPESFIRKFAPAGIILSGGPNSVIDGEAPRAPASVWSAGVPVLGICYGMQTMAAQLGGAVENGLTREFGYAQIRARGHGRLLKGIQDRADADGHGLLDVWMSHGDKVTALPPGFTLMASNEATPIAAMMDESRRYYAVQFHPEVTHTPQGKAILKRFVRDICGCEGDWTMPAYADEAVAKIRAQVGTEEVILGLSGGVDSSVAAALIHRAISDQLTCVFVDTGLLRLNEAKQVMETFAKHLGVKVLMVDASEVFLRALAGIADPEEKRKIIGREFIHVFQAEAARLPNAKWLAQGTIYPDVIESAGSTGLGVRILGEVRREHAELLRRADAIFIDELRKTSCDAIAPLGETSGAHPNEAGAGPSNWYDAVAQAFAVFLPVRSVGVMGDGRTYEHVVALRAVQTTDFMTAHWAPLPHELLATVSSRIINEVRGINRVVYDISGKPPATIEWE